MTSTARWSTRRLPRDIQLQPLDLFRLEPGDGSVDFTNAPRALDPAMIQVFYDGGTFDPYGIDIARLQRGDIPLSTGSTYGNGGQASHWRDDMDALMHRVYVGLMDPFGNPSEEANLTFMDRVAFDLIGWDVVGGGIPADWRGVTLEQFSNDRNVMVVTELEPADTSGAGTNALPATSQFLGILGQGEKNSDDNLRLGFEIHGLLARPSDVDVYSFTATGGTEVWLDIDRTSSALDSVVEVIDSNGRLLARSDNSLAEHLGEEFLFAAPGISAYGLQRSVFRPEDFWSVNPKDAGMRLILPGPAEDTRTYNIRVRSSSENLDQLTGGETSGAYQLQIRLRDLDEHAGSTVQFADIRYATDGIRVKGLPRRSPLVGEQTEDALLEESFGIGRNNDTEMPRNSKSVLFSSLQDAHYLGDLMATDQATISVAGNLNSFIDVDWYRFYMSTSGSVVMDLDYASGLNRANASFWIYEAALVDDLNPSGAGGYMGSEGYLQLGIAPGTLVYSSQDGRITDDMPAPLNGDDLDDLSRGSISPFDPFLGPIALPPGEYLLLVTSGDKVPCEVAQFTERLACNPYMRAEPIPEMMRIAEDRVNFDVPPPSIPIPELPPQVPVLVDPNGAAVPFHLSDVQLFVSTATSLSTVDPFTGLAETYIGDYAGDFPNVGNIRPTIADFALRDNPQFQRPVDDPNNPDDPVNTDATRRQRLYAYTVDRGDGIITRRERRELSVD